MFSLFALLDRFYETTSGRTVLHAMPVLLGALCVLAIAYRYYSAFLAARVAALDDARPTPAHRFYDGQNYDPTNKWVLFGHHFAAIAGAGPLIGPVLAIQYGYVPGLLWLVIGVCLAGAVQDMLVLAASVRRGGKSLAEIARTELGRRARAGPGQLLGDLYHCLYDPDRAFHGSVDVPHSPRTNRRGHGDRRRCGACGRDRRQLDPGIAIRTAFSVLQR